MRYTVLLRKETESGGYWVEVPDLPGCFSAGDTLDEALVNVREAIELHLQGMMEDGESILPEGASFVVAAVEVELPAIQVTRPR